jgi:hypothetical protein
MYDSTTNVQHAMRASFTLPILREYVVTLDNKAINV